MEEDQLVFPLKKKKKVINVPDEVVEENNDTASDYSYADLLDRLYEQLGHRNEETKRAIVPIPKLVFVGTRKTLMLNFQDISKSVSRDKEHLLLFFVSELATTGSIDSQARLLVRGRFRQGQVETIVRKYIAGYVACTSCRGLDTTLVKDERRITFMECNKCHATRSVMPIKSPSTER